MSEGTWSTNSDGNFEFTTEETIDGATLTVTEVFDTDFQPISSSWSDGTNSSAIGEEVKTVSFDYNGDGSATSAEVIEETGSTTWTWMDGDTAVSYTHLTLPTKA